MKTLAALFVAGLLLAMPAAGRAVDWKSFEDPKAVVLTDLFAMSVRELKDGERDAAMKRLHASLKADLVEIRRRAALTLHRLGDTAGVPVMMADMKTAGGRDRDNVVVALRIMKDARAIPALRDALKDKSAYVRGIAAAALGEMKAGKAYDDLVALTTDKEGKQPPANRNERSLDCIRICPAELACYALGALGDKRAVPVLIGLLDDADVQAPAARALQELTGQKFGQDAAKWKAWWKEQKK